MIRNYFKTALRNLLRNKKYAVINITGLTLGLTAFWLIALYVADELSYDRYNPNADRVVRVVQHASWDAGKFNIALTSPPFAPALEKTYPEIESIVRIDPEGGGIISAGDKKIKADDVIFADKSFFKIFPEQFLYGDVTTALDNTNSIVITETLARKLFGNSENALNKNISFDNEITNMVTGVIKDVPGNSHLRFSGVRLASFDPNDGWQNFHIYTYLLLKNGTDYKALQKKLVAFAANTIQKDMGVKDYTMELQPLLSIHLHSNLDFEISPNGNMSRVYTFVAIALLILVIAIINYINLSTARASSRVREIGVRKVIGSGKKHLAGMFISESVLVTMIAAIIAMYVIKLSLPLFNDLSGKNLHIWRFGMYPTLLVLALCSILIGIINGLYPSFFLSRFKTIPALKGEMGNVKGNILFRKSLVVFQFVITVVMICGSIVIYKQLQFATHTDLGFNKDQVLTFHIDDRNVRNQIPALRNQLLQSPLITGVSAAGNPIGNNNLGGAGYNYENNEGVFTDNSKIIQELEVDPEYLTTMEIKLLKGRNFSDQFPSDSTKAIVVNEALVKELGWKNPIGKRMIKISDNNGQTEPRTVIGVIKDFHTYSLQHKVAPLAMVLPRNANAEDNLYVKLEKGKITEGLAYLNKVYRQFDKQNPIEYNFLNQNFAKQYTAEKKQGEISLIFTILAILVACLGLFGLITFSAEQRTKEIGIRKVLGADVKSIVQMLSADFLKLVLVATLIAFPVSWMLMNRWLQEFAYRIHINWSVFVLAGITVLFVALATISIQALRAAVANPTKSLRAE